MPFWLNFIMKDRNDFRSALSLKNIEKRYINGAIEILGIVENGGKVNWENIVIEAELCAKDGKFLDELTGRIAANLLPGASEHFKISSRQFPESRWESINDMKVKVSDAYHSKY